MDLDWSEEQRQLGRTMAQFFTREAPIGVVRAAELADPPGWDPSLWRKANAVGIASMALEAELLDLVVVADAAGAALAPIPAVESLVSTRLLAAADGQVPPPPAVTTIGLVPLVPAGAVADVIVALRRDRLVTLPGPGRPVTRTLGASPVAALPSSRGEVLLTGGPAADCWSSAVDEWKILTAAALTGLAATALRLGVDYAGQRRQFGVPIGSFQAVQHRLADIATAISGAQLLSQEAAWAADQAHPERHGLAAMAFYHAATTAQRAAETSLHVHGGYGYMLESDIQLYLRRAKAWSLPIGDPRRQLGAIADHRYGER